MVLNYILVGCPWLLYAGFAASRLDQGNSPRGGTPRNSWWVCAAQFSKSWPYFIPKTVIFYTRFQTRPLKSKPFFRPGLQTEIMSSFFRLERKQTISPNAYPIRKFLLRSYSFGVETINKFIHPRSSIENHTRFQIKMGKEYTRFQTRKDKNPTLLGGTRLCGLYRGVPSSWGEFTQQISWASLWVISSGISALPLFVAAGMQESIFSAIQ